METEAFRISLRWTIDVFFISNIFTIVTFTRTDISSHLLLTEEGNILYGSPLFVCAPRVACRPYIITNLTLHCLRGMAAKRGVVYLLIVGHYFVRRLANYALSAGEMNMHLNDGYCAATFIGGMSVPQLRSQFDEIVSQGPDVLYVEIGTIDISGRDPLYLADEVFELARSFSARVVRMVVIAQIFVSRNLAIGRRDSRVAPNFNERVVAHNLRMRELTQSTTSIESWRQNVGKLGEFTSRRITFHGRGSSTIFQQCPWCPRCGNESLGLIRAFSFM